MGNSICPEAKTIVFLKIRKKELKKPTRNGQRLSRSSINRNNHLGVLDLVKNPDHGFGILRLRSSSPRFGAYATSGII